MNPMTTPVGNLFTLAAALVLVAISMCLQIVYATEPTPAMTALKTRIESPKFEECIEFYTTLLGMQVKESWDEDGDRGAILGLHGGSTGEAFLELAPGEPSNSYEGISLQLRVPDIQAVAARLNGRWDFRGPEERPWGSTYLYLEDPAGLRVILYQDEPRSDY